LKNFRFFVSFPIACNPNLITIFAEFGGAILLEMIGKSAASDRGGCWQYVTAYATQAGKEPLAVCQMLLDRTCKAVALIVETAARLEADKLAIAA
jgi:hypothetical protein